MPILPYAGHCFVAFVDISGFKEMMKDHSRAIDVMGHFYQSGFDALRDEPEVHGLFVSDCGVLFSRSPTAEAQLSRILAVLKQLNRKMLCRDAMLVTSVAYGQFSFQERLEFQGISKQPIYGNAYVSAFYDNEFQTPKIQPGQTRFVAHGLPEEATLAIEQDPLFVKKKDHYYYYWMVDSVEKIDDFDSVYHDSYKRKFQGMLDALKAQVGFQS